MINDLIDVTTTLETYLNVYERLSYVEKKEIGLYRPDNLPDFDTYAIVIAPYISQQTKLALRTKQETCELKIVCICRNFDYRLSVIGKESPNIGIIAMVIDIKEALVNFGETYIDDLTINYDETDAPINFDSHPFPEREDFFHEVILPYKVKLKPKITGG